MSIVAGDQIKKVENVRELDFNVTEVSDFPQICQCKYLTTFCDCSRKTGINSPDKIGMRYYFVDE
jgi:hypothetical protein